MVFDSVRRRGDADTIMSPWLPVVPIVLLLVAFFLFLLGVLGRNPYGFLAFCTALVIGIIAIVVFLGIILYGLMKRRQEHFERDALLRRGMIEYLTARAERDGIDLEAELATLTWIDSSSRQEEPHRGPLLWTLLAVFVPFISGVMFLALSYILTRETGKHHWNQDGYYRQMSSGLYKLGLPPVVPPSWRPLPDRDPVLYIVLAIFIPFFVVYWLYALIADMNEHFMLQWEVEDNIVDVLRRN